jgi:N-acetylglutamate synthase-like GNAT family acetyltransferase
MPAALALSPVPPGDPALIAALDDAGLVTADLAETAAAGASFFRFAQADGTTVGYGGIEAVGEAGDPIGLLRSIVVLPAWRGRGLGQAITTALIARAAQSGISTLYLLTTTADGFFARLGFVPVDRSAAPPPVARSNQFRALCPASAVLMRRDLT